MPSGVYDRTKSKPNAGVFQKGKHYNTATEFKKGEHRSPLTEFGNKPHLSFEARNCNTPQWAEAQSLSHEGQHSSPLTEIKRGQHLSHATEFDGSMNGRKHWHWKGGISSDNQLFRSSGKYDAWRNAVFERDNYICQNCGVRGGGLEAHHIKSFAQYHELRLELSNGITLCKLHHRSEVMPNANESRPQKAL